MKSYEILETERLMIRPTSVEDASFILELLNTPKWIKYIGDRNVRTIEEAQKYIEIKMLPQLARLGYTNNTVILKETNQKIGVCGLFKREGLENLDIGFAFLPEFETKGYGFESSGKILEFAFFTLNAKAVSGITSKNNFASQKLLLKLGFTYQNNIILPNETEDVMVFIKNSY